MARIKSFFSLLGIVFYSFILMLLITPSAHAAVEYVAPVNSCTRVLESSDNRNLAIIAGQNVRFRVFGNSVDLSDPNSGFRMEPPNGTNGIFASIIPTNRINWGCGGTGFALVRIDSPIELTTNTRRTLFFKMPLGDESRL